jgi:hypothetical protein
MMLENATDETKLAQKSLKGVLSNKRKLPHQKTKTY